MRKRHSLRKELTVIMLLVSIITLMLVAVAVCYVFFSIFFKNTQKDIEYVLNNTTQQYQSHMQFIEDGAISIRHNRLLDDFFQNEWYDADIAKEQLEYSMELFSDRNRVNQQLPFVTGMYLFNNQDQCVKEHYYAATLTLETQQERYYKNLQECFKQEKDQYACIADRENLNILFRIYDDHMQEKGIGIAQINLEAIQEIFKDVENYQDYSWIVLSNHNLTLVSGGEEDQNERMKETAMSWNGSKKVEGRRVIGSADAGVFGLRTIISVGQSNVYAILRPTIIAFLTIFGNMLVFIFLASYGITYRFTKPVTRMIENISAFGKQDLDVRMEDSSIQEFHDIGVVFNEMADRLEYLITEVYEKQLLATKSQVKYLQSQLNPHFQFNILAMLSLKAKMAGNEEVYDGLNAFSRLMQGKIFREKEIKIKVKEELEIVQFYLYLQKSRYQDKLSYEVKLEDEKIGEDLIPRLLIEPLVENAVSHGLEPKRGKGNLQVLLYEREMLYIWVKDDGVGVCRNQTKAEENKEKTPHTHVGWENTKKMLRILYGDYYKFQVWSEPGKGTEIEIAVPIERGGNYVESGSSR